MARLTYAETITAIGALLPDNTTELITPAKLREAITDVLNCLQPALAGLTGFTGGALSLTPADQKITLFDAALAPVGQTGVMTADPATDNITTTLVGVHDLGFSVDSDGPNNQGVIFTVYRDGVATAILDSVTTRGPGNKVSTTFTFPMQAAAPGPHVFDIRVKTDTGSASVTFSNMLLTLSFIPGQ